MDATRLLASDGDFMFKRYAVFYTPQGALADWGAAWLGWDSSTGAVPLRYDLAGVDVPSVTQTPQKYGLHGTLKAPFTLVSGVHQETVEEAAASFARQHAAFDAGPFALRYENGFVALRPLHDPANLRDFAAATVRDFDHLRAPLSEADIARRRRARLSPRQDQQMLVWGYPYIFDDFHFHLTLSGRLREDAATQIIAALSPQVAPLLPKTLMIDAITLMGEDVDGMFHQIHRYALSG
jgi:hypothetical protein